MFFTNQKSSLAQEWAACVIAQRHSVVRHKPLIGGKNLSFNNGDVPVLLFFFFLIQRNFYFVTVWCFQVPIGGQSVHYVSHKRNTFYPMKLPKYTLPKVRLPGEIHQQIHPPPFKKQKTKKQKLQRVFARGREKKNRHQFVYSPSQNGKTA